jgi:predicted outer membrane repeat protein
MRPLPVSARGLIAGGLVTGVLALTAAAAPAALAAPAIPVFTPVPCSVAVLDVAIASAAPGAVLGLAPGCHYVLNAPLATPAVSLTILGDGATIQRSFVAPAFDTLTVGPGRTVRISHLTVSNGGGALGRSAILNLGDLVLTGDSFVGNHGGPGGAIHSSGFLDVSNSQFTANTALPPGGNGGAIENTGTALVANSTFTGNRSAAFGGAFLSTFKATLVNDSFHGNSAVEGGGAVASSGVLNVVHGSFFGIGNSVTGPTGRGGALYTIGLSDVSDSLFFNNASSDIGGAIAIDGGSLLLDHDSIADNSAAVAGGGIVRLAGTVTLLHTGVGFNHPNNCRPIFSVPGCFN